MTQAAQLAQYGANNVGLSFKNRIINGDMSIDQRNAGASVTLNGSLGQYGVDRFAYNTSQASRLTAQQSTTVPVGFYTSNLITVSSAATIGSGDYFTMFQHIEANNVSDLNFGTANAKTVTLSFWVRSSVTGTFVFGLLNSSLNRTYLATYTISAANTWEQKSVTIAGDTTGTWTAGGNGIGMTVRFDLGSGSSGMGTANAWQSSNVWSVSGSASSTFAAQSGATFFITGLQLEVGSVATSFDYLPYGTELMLCQRYFETNYPAGNAVGSSTASYTGLQMNLINPANGITYVPLQCNVQKRANATWTVYTYTGTVGQWHFGVANATETAAAVSVNNMGDKMAMIYLSSTPASNQNTMYGRWVASAEL
jgi:hypothetical protein